MRNYLRTTCAAAGGALLFIFTSAYGEMSVELAVDVVTDAGREKIIADAIELVDTGALIVGRTSIHGQELFYSDGTSDGTVLLRDISPGGVGSSFGEIGTHHGKHYFSVAEDGGGGHDLWEADCSTLQARRVADVNGALAFARPVSFDGYLFFTSSGALWRSDGTDEGTVAMAFSDPPARELKLAGDTLFFSGSEWLWALKAGSNMPEMVPFEVNPAESLSPWNLTSVNETLVFIGDGYEIYMVTPEGAIAATGMRSVEFLGQRETNLFFKNSFHPGYDHAIWRWDVAAREAHKVVEYSDAETPLDFYFTSFGNFKHNGALAVVDETTGWARTLQSQVDQVWYERDGLLFFTSSISSEYKKLFATDGEVVYSFNTDRRLRLYEEVRFRDGDLYISSENGTFRVHNTGVEGLSVAVNEMRHSSDPGDLFALGDSLLFTADDPVAGREPWRYRNGDVEMVSDVEAGAFGSDPKAYFEAGGRIFCIVDVDNDGELWSLDVDTGMSGPAFPSKRPAGLKESIRAGRHTFLKGERELWVTDGSEEGTRFRGLVYTGSLPIHHGKLWTWALFQAPEIEDAFETVSIGSQFLYRISSASGPYFTRSGVMYRVWRSYDVVLYNGTAPGRRTLWSPEKAFGQFAELSDKYLFFSEDQEIWALAKSGGAPEFVIDLGTGQSGFRSIVDRGEYVLIIGHGGSGRVFRTDGTEAGTYALLQGVQGASSISAVFGWSNIQFLSQSHFGLTRLWATDGTSDGTIDLTKEFGLLYALGATAADTLEAAIFTADTEEWGSELWRSDGTLAGTYLLADINPGAASSSPGEMTAFEGSLYFAATEPMTGRELWRVNTALPSSAEDKTRYFHSIDQNEDGIFQIGELLRLIQFYNSGGYHCDVDTEDTYAPGAGNRNCDPSTMDVGPTDWRISLSELLRGIQFFNSGGYYWCMDGEDGFCAAAVP